MTIKLICLISSLLVISHGMPIEYTTIEPGTEVPELHHHHPLNCSNSKNKEYSILATERIIGGITVSWSFQEAPNNNTEENIARDEAVREVHSVRESSRSEEITTEESVVWESRAVHGGKSIDEYHLVSAHPEVFRTTTTTGGEYAEQQQRTHPPFIFEVDKDNNAVLTKDVLLCWDQNSKDGRHLRKVLKIKKKKERQGSNHLK